MSCNDRILKIPFEGEWIVQGDTIGATELEFIDEDIDLNTATARLKLWDGNTVVMDVTTGNGITVVDSYNLIIDQVEKENNNLPPKKLIGNFSILDENGELYTYNRVEYTITKKKP